jgi:hypothetical protein
MKTRRFNLGAGLQTLAATRALSLVGITVGLVGCADTYWERAVYQGARYGGEQCQLKRSPSDAPCAQLGDYERYTEERNTARSASPSPIQVHAVEETQR